MTTDQTNYYTQITKRLMDLIDVLKFQRVHYPDELTWFQRALIHQEHSAWFEVRQNLEIGENKPPRYQLHKRLRRKVNALIKKMHEDEQ